MSDLSHGIGQGMLGIRQNSFLFYFQDILNFWPCGKEGFRVRIFSFLVFLAVFFHRFPLVVNVVTHFSKQAFSF